MKEPLLFAILVIAFSTATAQKSKVDTSQVFTDEDKSPEFPGGEIKFQAYINKSLDKIHRKDNKSGGVVVVSVVEKDGSFSHCKAEISLNAESDSIATSIIGKTPKWIPGYKNGKPVRCKYSVLIKFGKPDPDMPLTIERRIN